MQEANQMRERLIKEFTENYTEKLFYFCLKKTGNHDEAEDLTQDIALHILTALNKGTIPTSFSAWVWQIARNRYSAWATEKHDRRGAVADSDIGDYEIAAEGGDTLGEMIHAEQMALLRRELAFIRREYRNIVVAYYIEDRSVRDIASALSLSKSTVEQRLFRARQILKEGMNMAREFGPRSYKPEDITFQASGDITSNLPWGAVQRQIQKNILLQASNNPSTAQELSIELGVALPYMEDEVEFLFRATLLEKQGDRYITNFFILDKDCRIEVYHALRSEAKERSRLLREFIEEKRSDIRELAFAGTHIGVDAINWWLIPHLIDRLIMDVGKGTNIYAPPTRSNGESWGFVGYEIATLPEETLMGSNLFGDEDNMFWAYRYYKDYAIAGQLGDPAYEDALQLCDCIRNHRRIASFTDKEKGMWGRINGRFAHASEDGEIIPDTFVTTWDKMNAFYQLFKEHRHYEPLTRNVKRSYEKVEEIFKKYNHKVLHEYLTYYVPMELCGMRLMAVHDLVEDGFLKLPEEPGMSPLGTCFLLN